MTIQCVITDDEPMARKGLQGYIEKVDYLKLAGACENVIELDRLLRTSEVDLLFLDIEMPYVKGIDFLKHRKDAPKVIITTAYPQYALEGYELDVMDYLMKPISFERFLKATGKAHDYFEREQRSEDYFFVKAEGNRLEKIVYKDLILLEARENYVALHLANRKILAHATLKSFVEQLPTAQFLQTHKSYIVNIQCVSAIEGNNLICPPYEVPVSKYLKEEVMQRLIPKRGLGNGS